MGLSNLHLWARLGGADTAGNRNAIQRPGSKKCAHLLARLIAGQTRREPYQVAAALIDRFATLEAVLAARTCALREVLADEPGALRHLKLLRRADLHMRRNVVVNRPMLGNWQALLDYLRSQQAFRDVEEVRVLFLNTRNTLIRDEVVVAGTVDQAPVYVREIVKRALELSAAAIILVHNHPCGDPRPSRSDIQITRLLADAGKKLGVTLHDHLIFAERGHSSLRAMGLM